MSNVEDLERMRQFGAFEERQRIVQLLETQPFIWAGDVQMLTVSRDALIDLINADLGNCDTCNKFYELSSRFGRCGDCGECAEHCDHVPADEVVNHA
jgi:hypothetical protein